MAQQDRPQRSLRKDGGPRYYRDWSGAQPSSAASSAADMDDYEDDYGDAYSGGPEELQMVEGFDPEAPVAPPPVMQQEMAPLNVIVPETPMPGTEPEPKKPTITRVDGGARLKRARRINEIQAEEAAVKAEEEAAREAASRQAPPDQSAKTRSLAKTTARTTELQSNIREIEEKIDETRENVKSTANALSENIRQISEKVTVSVVGGIQKVGKNLNGLISRFGGKKADSDERDYRDEDFEDEPIPSQSRGQQAIVDLPEPPPGYGEPAPKAKPKKKADPLDQVPHVPPVQYAALLKEGVLFQTFDKQQLVIKPESLDPETLQTQFVENALQDIRKCIKLVKDLPDPTEGPYTGIPLAYTFKNIREQDLFFFMHYVLSKPDPFRKKTFKISEAFATWILKRSATTVVSEAFPDVRPVSYYPLYQNNIRFQTLDKKQLVLASGKSPEEVEALFMERALDDIRNCISLVEKFPPATQGPYKGKPLRQVFKFIKERDIYFFLHYVRSQPEVFRGQNFKFAEAFASWILKRSHETELPG